MTMLRWTVIIMIFLGFMGCSTTKIDWEMAHGVNTVKAYQEFLKKHPDSEFSEQARVKLEPLSYQKAIDTGTLNGYAAYLMEYPQGAHGDELRAKIEEIRCQDLNLTTKFPSWLRKGKHSDPEVRPRWFLGESYIGVEPSSIGRGFKAAGDDPAFPIEIELAPNYVVYYGGRGIIVGSDGVNVLVGYDCK